MRVRISLYEHARSRGAEIMAKLAAVGFITTETFNEDGVVFGEVKDEGSFHEFIRINGINGAIPQGYDKA